MKETPTIALVADDHELPRVALSALLRGRLGFDEVIETASLDEALDRLETAPPVAIALVDLYMPGVDTPFSLQAIREIFPDMKLAVVSASTRRDDMLKALAAGVHGYILKTMRLDEMETALREVLAGRICVPPSIAQLPPPSPPVANAPSQTADLTERQREVLALLGEGRSNKEIARDLGLGLGTVKIHVAGLFRALGVANRAGAVAAAALASKTASD